MTSYVIITKVENGYLIEIPMHGEINEHYFKACESRQYVVSIPEECNGSGKAEAEAWRDLVNILQEHIGPEYNKYGEFNAKVVIAPGHKRDSEPGKCTNCGEPIDLTDHSLVTEVPMEEEKDLAQKEINTLDNFELKKKRGKKI